MSKGEILATGLGEMSDMIACMAIHEGGAMPKKEKIKWDYDDAINLR